MRRTIHKQNRPPNRTSLIARYCLAAVVLLALLGPLAGESRGDFILQDDEQLIVSSPHDQGVLFDRSRVSIVSGGSVNNLYANNSSTVNISGGSVDGELLAYDSSTVNVSGGSVEDYLYAYDSSAVNISGGYVSKLHAYESSAVNISGGSVGWYGLDAYGSSTVNISAGCVGSMYYGGVTASGSSAVNISGGSVSGDLFASGSSAVAISGGSVSGRLFASGSVAVDISGGSVYGSLTASLSTGVNISAGSVTALYAYDSSTVDISGGSVSGRLTASDSSAVDISGGSVSGNLFAYHESTVNISGGSVSGDIFASGSSAVAISGGSVSGSLYASDSSAVAISGGISVGTVPYLYARDSSVVSFYGRNFRVGGGLVFDGDYVLGEGVLVGEWFDGTLWAVNITEHTPSATILAVPAPPEPLHILTIDVDPNAVGIDTITPSVGAHDYAGVWVSIKAERFINCPDVYTFAHWDGDVNDPNSANTRVFMDSDKTITAVFVDDRQCGDECHPYPSGDVNKDCKVDFLDIAMVASSWLECTRPECD